MEQKPYILLQTGAGGEAGARGSPPITTSTASVLTGDKLGYKRNF